MERPQFTQEQIGSINVQMTVTDLINEFYQRFGDETFAVTKKFVLRWSQGLGDVIKERAKITATDASTVAEVLNSSLQDNTKLVVSD